MPRKITALLLVLLLMPLSGAQAKLEIDWSHATKAFTPAKKQQLARLVKEASGLFMTDAYADLGKYDFEASERTLLIQVRDFGVNREYGLQLSGVVYLNQLHVSDPDELRVVLVHEFTHLYDFCALAEMTVDYLFSAESGDARVAEKRLDGPMRTVQRIKYAAEQRAQDKAARFAREHGLKIPGEIE